MEEAVQKFPKVRHRHYLTWLLVVILVGVAACFWWRNKASQERILVLQEEAAALRAVNEEFAARPVPETASSAWTDAVNKAPLCGEWIMSDSYKVPAPEALKELGLKELLDEGYRVFDLCVDIGDGRVAFLAAASDPEERDLFGTADIKTGRLYYKRSELKLGLTAGPPTVCHLDGVKAGATAAEDRLLVYCGTDADGGLTRWYGYDIKDDKLTLAQEFTGAENNEYTVWEGAVLDQFNIRRRP